MLEDPRRHIVGQMEAKVCEDSAQTMSGVLMQTLETMSIANGRLGTILVRMQGPEPEQATAQAEPNCIVDTVTLLMHKANELERGLMRLENAL